MAKPNLKAAFKSILRDLLSESILFSGKMPEHDNFLRGKISGKPSGQILFC
jgi:hypothetical protein